MHYLRKANFFYVEEDPKNYKAIQILLDCGLEDSKFSNSFDYSFLTSLLDETKYEKKIRIDYILVNDKLKKYNPTSSIIHCPGVEKISDHYPVECYWENN